MTEILSVSLSDEQAAVLREIIRRNRTERSRLMRKALYAYLSESPNGVEVTEEEAEAFKEL